MRFALENPAHYRLMYGREALTRQDLPGLREAANAIFEHLDHFGMHYIEAGWPGSNPKDAELFVRARSLPLEQAKLCSFGATRRSLRIAAM